MFLVPINKDPPGSRGRNIFINMILLEIRYGEDKYGVSGHTGSVWIYTPESPDYDWTVIGNIADANLFN